MVDFTRGDVQAWREETAALKKSMDSLRGAMQVYAPRHEVDDAIRDEVAKLGTKVARAIEDSQHAGNAALKASLNANEAATKAVRSAREAQAHVRRVRFREWARIIGAFGLGAVAMLAVIDRHVHVHLSELERQLNGGLNLGSRELPLFPVHGQDVFPLAIVVCVVVVVASAVLLLASRNGDS